VSEQVASPGSRRGWRVPTRDAAVDVGERPRGAPLPRVALWAMIGVPVVVAVVAAWTHRFLVDDGFINLRVISQIEHGHGPVFNQGQRVEVFTSPLWIAVLTVADVVLPIRLEWLAVAGGIALLAVGMVLAACAAARLQPRTAKQWYVPVGLLVMMALPPMWRFASSGLENGLTCAWLGASAFVLAGWARTRTRLSVLGAVLIGLGPLVRPDVAIFSALFLVVVLVADGRGWQSRVTTLACALAVPVAYQVFRMGYYGMIVPNTALAKSAGSSRWGAGLDYVGHVFRTYWLYVPVAILLAVAALMLAAMRGGDETTDGSDESELPARTAVTRWARPRRRLLVTAAFVLGAGLSALYVVKVGGDYEPTRLLLPAVFALATPVALVPLRPAYALGLTVVPWALVSLLFLRDATDRNIRILGPPRAVTLADFGWQPGGPNRTWFTGAGVYASQGPPLPVRPPAGHARPIVIAPGIGIISYALGPNVDVFDVLGLAEPIASHEKLRRRGYVGHEKLLPAPWVVALTTAPGSTPPESDFIVAPPPLNFGFRVVRIVRQDDPRGRPFAERVATARVVLECPRMKRFLAAFDAPMSLHRFVDNISGSVGRTTLEIPPEPADAAKKLCPAARPR
jgi:arabinofuranosyltransferase